MVLTTAVVLSVISGLAVPIQFGAGSAAANAQTSGGDVAGCTTIDSSGVYNLTADITDSPRSTCIEITASNVVFDGGGHTIDGTDASNTVGVEVNGTDSTVTNVVVRNVTVTDWAKGINYGGDNGSEEGRIADVNASSNGDGIFVEFTAPNTTIRDTVTTGNSDEGLEIEGNGAVLTNVTTTNNGGQGIEFDDRPILNTDELGLEATLRDVNASGNDNVGIKMGGDDTGLPGSNLTNITAMNNDDDGVEVDSGNVTLRNAVLTGNARRGVSADGHGLTHVNVTAYGNGNDDVKTDEGGSARDVTVSDPSTNDMNVYFRNEDSIIVNEVETPPDPSSPPTRVGTGRYAEFDRRDGDQLNISINYECQSPCWLPDLWWYNGSAGWEQFQVEELRYSPGEPRVSSSLQNWETSEPSKVWYNTTNFEPAVHGVFLPLNTVDTPEVSIATRSSLTVTFDAQVDESNVNVTGYAWRFGDGTTGNGSEVTHTYDSEGTYDVKLFVDTENGTVLAEKTITATDESGDDSGDTGTPEDDAPEITNYAATADGEEITVRFDSDENLVDIEAEISGPEDATLTEADFSGSPAAGYEATYRAPEDGEYTVELVSARDAGNEEAVGTETFSATVSAEGADTETPAAETPTAGDDTETPSDPTVTPTRTDDGDPATATPTAEPAAGTATETDAGAATGTETGADGAGLGVGVALAALSGAGYLLRRRTGPS